MPLLNPLNDHGCLRKLHQNVTDYMQTDQARALASQFTSVSDVIEFIRRLEQRDDLGDPRDGPRLACEVTQRLRLPALDPNCFERLALYLALALIIEPKLDLTSATMMLDNGLHSFPVEIRDGRPRAVVLDPMTSPPRNAMTAAAYELRNASPLAEPDIGPWFAEVARHACSDRGAEDCYEIAMDAIRGSLLTGLPIRNAAEIDCVLDLAYEDAQLFGAIGRVAFDRVCKSLRNLSIKLDAGRVTEFLTDLAKEAKPMASDAIKAVLIAKFGPVASIALQGVELQKTENTDTNPDHDQDHAAVALANLDMDDEQDKEANDEDRPLTPEQKRQRMRRMTLAYRPPKDKAERKAERKANYKD